MIRELGSACPRSATPGAIDRFGGDALGARSMTLPATPHRTSATFRCEGSRSGSANMAATRRCCARRSGASSAYLRMAAARNVGWKKHNTGSPGRSTGRTPRARRRSPALRGGMFAARMRARASITSSVAETRAGTSESPFASVGWGSPDPFQTIERRAQGVHERPDQGVRIPAAWLLAPVSRIVARTPARRGRVKNGKPAPGAESTVPKSARPDPSGPPTPVR